MKLEYFLPIDKIPLHSRIVLYGMGASGTSIKRHNDKFGLYDIVAVVDSQFEKKPEVQSPDILSYIVYDYILICVLNQKVNDEIYESLLQRGIPSSKIIKDTNTFFYEDGGNIDLDYSMESMEKDTVQIGFYPIGSMGDDIMSLKLYQAIIKIEPNVSIDVYMPNKPYAESIMFGQQKLKRIIDKKPGEDDKKAYDFFISVRFEPVLEYYKVNAVKQKSSVLAQHLDKLYAYQKEDYVDVPGYQYANRILFDRAKLLGMNRYTLMSCSGAFHIQDQKIDFYINPEYIDKYQSFKLGKKYITFNYGAGRQLSNGVTQTKMWPIEYHVRLNQLIREGFPEIKIVQLGASNAIKVDGADYYILGEDLDVVKYILNDSLLHFDCEGGLVHIASQLGTKCAVVFGPTPAWFFGYPNNINIVSTKCGECKGLIKDWYTRCIRFDRPECMYSIKPDVVYKEIKKYLDSLLGV